MGSIPPVYNICIDRLADSCTIITNARTLVLSSSATSLLVQYKIYENIVSGSLYDSESVSFFNYYNRSAGQQRSDTRWNRTARDTAVDVFLCRAQIMRCTYGLLAGTTVKIMSKRKFNIRIYNLKLRFVEFVIVN